MTALSRRIIWGVLSAACVILGACGDTSPSNPDATSVQSKSAESSTTVSSSKGDPKASTWWRPAVGASWQWQLSGKLDLAVDADVYDIDGDEATSADVEQLHSLGRKAICYVSAGSYESYRADEAQIPEALRGKVLDGWPDERWLDIRQTEILASVMGARFDNCVSKGFDAVEPDNVDGYANDSGFDLTEKDQLGYIKMLTKLAHDRGLAIGLKNAVELSAELAPTMDFAVNESCMEYDECELVSPFIEAGKPVFHVEYDMELSEFCPRAQALGFSSLRKSQDLDATREACD